MAYTTINKGSSYFNTILYTGNGTARSLTGVNFKPDFTWIKSRSNASWWHQLQNVVSGATKRLASNDTDSETTDVQSITSFNADGFSLGTSTSYNNNADTYVAWNWLASNTTTSNTSGSITSTVSANTTAGFSVVSWTASGATSTVGHGLGVAPSMIIFKDRGNTTNWFVYHKSIGATGALYLNATNSTVTNSIFFNNTAPTSSVFTVSTYLSASPYIAYCFADVKGYSKFGSYTGNGSADGTFVYTGFKPAFLMIKRTDTGDGWLMFDDVRNTFNPESSFLQANLANAEGTFSYCDFTSNGFKARTSAASFNASGGTYIYMAFAENPFVTSGGIPVTAR
jgi:hypothetical protein